MPPFSGRVPYVAAIVDLDEGPRAMTNVVDCEPEDLAVGMALEVTFAAISDELTSGRLGDPIHFNGHAWLDYALDPLVPMTWRYRGGAGSGVVRLMELVLRMDSRACGELWRRHADSRGVRPIVQADRDTRGALSSHDVGRSSWSGRGGVPRPPCSWAFRKRRKAWRMISLRLALRPSRVSSASR